MPTSNPTHLGLDTIRAAVSGGGRLYWRLDIEQTIADIERLERLYAVPDRRPMNAGDISAANRRHDELLARSPWFRLWRDFGVCCRRQPSEFPLGNAEP